MTTPLPPDLQDLTYPLAIALAVRCRDSVAVRQIAARMAQAGEDTTSTPRMVRGMLDAAGSEWLRTELAGNLG
jgi:hypothetical protein